MTMALGAWLPPLTRARVAAERHMAVFELVDDAWKEETVTELVLAGAWPEVRWASFTRHQESTTGADWFWWWVDASGACFGMLVQAKRVKWSPAGSPSIDFAYNAGKQRTDLLQTAKLFGVPAVYALYAGTPHPARTVYCPEDPHPGPGQRCDRCHRASVSLYAASLVTVNARTAAARARRAMQLAYPLEDAADLAPTRWTTRAAHAATTAAPHSSRAVAKRLMEQITAGLALGTAPQAPPTVPSGTYGWLRESDLQWRGPHASRSPDGSEPEPRVDVASGSYDEVPDWVRRAVDRTADGDPDVPENVAGVVVVRLAD